MKKALYYLAAAFVAVAGLQACDTEPQALDLQPFMALEMRLGEGSGCPIAFEIIKGACDVMANMATFDEAAINDGYLEEIRSQEKYQR